MVAFPALPLPLHYIGAVQARVAALCVQADSSEEAEGV